MLVQCSNVNDLRDCFSINTTIVRVDFLVPFVLFFFSVSSFLLYLNSTFPVCRFRPVIFFRSFIFLFFALSTMAKATFVLLLKLTLLLVTVPQLTNAANDWSKPCFGGVCSWDLPTSSNGPSGTLKIVCFSSRRSFVYP